MTAPPDAVAAAQETLAAEHAAVYVYGVLGAQTSRSAQPDLFTRIEDAYTRHRARRDLLDRTVRDLGAEPVAAAAAYEVPDRLGTPARVEAVARGVEESSAATYAWLVSRSTGGLRRWAVEALNDAAARVLTLRGTPEMLPGAGEYADR